MPLHIRIKRTLQAARLACDGDIAWSKVWFVACTGAVAVVTEDGSMYFTNRAFQKIFFGPANAEAITLGHH